MFKNSWLISPQLIKSWNEKDLEENWSLGISEGKKDFYVDPYFKDLSWIWNLADEIKFLIFE